MEPIIFMAVIMFIFIVFLIFYVVTETKIMRKVAFLEDQQKRIIRVLIEYAKENPTLEKILKEYDFI